MSEPHFNDLFLRKANPGDFILYPNSGYIELGVLCGEEFDEYIVAVPWAKRNSKTNELKWHFRKMTKYGYNYVIVEDHVPRTNPLRWDSTGARVQQLIAKQEEIRAEANKPCKTT